MPAEKVNPLVAPPAPEIGVGPEAVRTKAVATAVPPLSFVTTFETVKLGAMSSFVIVQLTVWPRAREIVAGKVDADGVPPVHTRLEA